MESQLAPPGSFDAIAAGPRWERKVLTDPTSHDPATLITTAVATDWIDVSFAARASLQIENGAANPVVFTPQGSIDAVNWFPVNWKPVAPQTVLGTNPAANAEIAEAVPAGKVWTLLAVSVSLVQGLTQTPQPILVVDDGANVIFESFGSSAAQAVSTTCRYTWAPNLPLTGQIGSAANVHSTAPLPGGLVLPAGYRIRTSTLGLGANSDYGAASLFIAETAPGARTVAAGAADALFLPDIDLVRFLRVSVGTANANGTKFTAMATGDSC